MKRPAVCWRSITAHSLFNCTNFVLLTLTAAPGSPVSCPMNEFELIARLTGSLASNSEVLAGAGDDCAVLDSGRPGRALLLKTDAVVEGIHFLPSAEPERVGHKALARCLSDVAAMAGRPIAALVTLALPKNFDPEHIQKIYAGMNALARRHGLAIAAGKQRPTRSGC